MNRKTSTNTSHPRLASLNSEWQDSVRDLELREAAHHESLEGRRRLHSQKLARKNRQADLTEEIELERLQSLRQLRRELDTEVIAAHDVAAKAFANLGLAYIPGKSTVDDLYKAPPLPDGEAASRAGVPIACGFNDKLLKVLKYAGMVGCVLLGTIGMGALLLHVAPRSLFHSPLALVALGLALILVGGVYITIAPYARRVGALRAAQGQSPTTFRACLLHALFVSFMCLIVALVDAKALMAINGARALVNPASAPSFAFTFLVSLALSASYVLATSFLSFNEGYAAEAMGRIEMERHRHAEAFKKERSGLLEVAQACEALNTVGVVEVRRKALGDEIRQIELELRESVEALESAEATPEAPEEHRKERRLLEQEARFASQKLSAYERVHANTNQSGTEQRDGGER